jgi:hypothetical protein
MIKPPYLVNPRSPLYFSTAETRKPRKAVLPVPQTTPASTPSALRRNALCGEEVRIIDTPEATSTEVFIFSGNRCNSPSMDRICGPNRQVGTMPG